MLPLSKDRASSSLWVNALAGAFSGVVSRLVIAPLDLLKIRLQLQHENYIGPSRWIQATPKYSGILQATRLIVAEEGIRALWRGSLAGIYLYAPYMSVQFVVYNQSKKWIQQIPYQSLKNEVAQNFVCGASAACCATLASYPFDILRTRLASQGKNKENYSGIIDGSKKIYQKDGLRGFYRGVGVTLMGVIPAMGLQFSMYEWMNRKVMKTVRDNFNHSSFPLIAGGAKFFIGFASGALAKFMTMPLDVMKRRLQMAGVERDPVFGRWHNYSGSIGECASEIWKGEGWRGFFKGPWMFLGTVPSILKAAPTSAVAFVSFEVCVWCIERLKS